MAVTFLYPAAGWLFVLLPLLWWTARAPRRSAHVALRGGVFACLILALMQPSLIHRAGAAPQVFVLDQRDDLGTAARAQARGALAALLSRPAEGRRTLIQLGGAPVTARVNARAVLGGSSMSAALARALEELPLGAGGRITVVSDGRSTDRHWDAVIDALVRRGIAVDTVVLASPARPAFVADVVVAAARAGERVQVTVAVEGDGRDHVVTLSSGARLLAVSAPVRADGPTRVALSFPAGAAGFMPLRATLSGAAGAFDTVVAVQDPLRLLYVGARQVGAAALLRRLLGAGVAVDERPAGALAGGVDPARYPLVFLDDVPAAQLGAAAQRRLAAAVADDGVGLLASGGEAAFGMGGYAGGPLAATLPVRARQDEKLEQPTVALAVVVDTSGSMGGTPLDLAKQVVRQTVRKLKPTDHVGVVEFYGARQWAVPMQLARQLPDVERAVARMQAQGGTTLFPALEEAYYGLKDVDARYRHLLVISDGGVEEARYQQLLRHIADDRVTVSTVQVGNDPSGEKSMADWARIGRGRFYAVPDEFGLVAIDFRQPRVKPDPGYRSGRYPLVAAPASGWWGDVRMAGMPPLDGHARVAARADAETLLGTASGDTVLASWQYGSGRVTALATEPLGAGTRGWRAWPDYGRWLARVVAMTARQRPDLTVRAARRFDRLQMVVQRFGAAAAGVPTIDFLAPDGRTIDTVTTAEARAPGLFVADVPYPARQAALIEARDGGSVARAAVRAFSDVSGTDALPLAALSAATGGRSGDGADAMPRAVSGAGSVATDLWPWLALLALALYLAEIAWRRRPSAPRRPLPASVTS